MLTTKQAAEHLGITPAGVRKLVERGQLRAGRFANALAFSPADVDRAKGRPAPGRPAATRRRAATNKA
jgi:excisionase family DNA binding protein